MTTQLWPNNVALAFEPAMRAPEQPSTLSPEEQRGLKLLDQLKPAMADAYNNLGVAAAAHERFCHRADRLSGNGTRRWRPWITIWEWRPFMRVIIRKPFHRFTK